jgi:hypothetical protein
MSSSIAAGGGNVSVDALFGAMEERLERAWQTSPEKYVSWLPDGAGFGNQMRGMTAALGLSLLTQRRFVIPTYEKTKSSAFFAVFDNPSSNFSINSGLVAPSSSHFKGALCRSGTSGQQFIENAQKAFRASETWIQHNGGCSFLHHYLKDEYASSWRDVFGIDYDLRWDTIETLVTMWLLRNPRADFLRSVHEVRNATRWDDFRHHVVVQVRTWVDIYKPEMHKHDAAKRKFEDECHLREINTLFGNVSEAVWSNETMIFVTSDSDGRAHDTVKLLQREFPDSHVASNTLFTNVHSSHSKDGLTKNTGMVDWFIMGDAEYALCSGTSFCISSRARMGMGHSILDPASVTTHTAGPFDLLPLHLAVDEPSQTTWLHAKATRLCNADFPSSKKGSSYGEPFRWYYGAKNTYPNEPTR